MNGDGSGERIIVPKVRSAVPDASDVGPAGEIRITHATRWGDVAIAAALCLASIAVVVDAVSRLYARKGDKTCVPKA